MYINITDSKTAKNKGSSGELVHYLEKENRLDYKSEPEYWFNHVGSRFEPYEVRQVIDGNVAKLGKGDAKFFLININPSQKELKHLAEKYVEMDIKDQLKSYSERLMDEYARNFKREGVNSSKDLLWFGKIENHRYYGFKDKEVISGKKKRGELKDGNQLHVQIIVSRKDVTNSIKLSPMNNSRGRNEAHFRKLGQFNRVAFKQCGEDLFDRTFDFDRQLKDKMVYANILKNGIVEQRKQLDFLEKIFENVPINTLKNDIASEIATGKSSTKDIFFKAGGVELFELLLHPTTEPEAQIPDQLKKRKRKKQGIDQGLVR
ncbi:DUF5712 family protein [Pedobacter xixiisoli]|uniref:Molybdopterin-guanine dinucleotide biosynthesis protein MobB n=1 Tax=Pedobacter xixiisoli TaxID=1476464 RepID=A0A286A741_9SPHI|nr:DUF5712 family protein [Pedobacter xixiisoli]SOD17641.1 hypothetical protein SAMN06297358_2611 [Pedobacter xixiisoli]